MAELERWVAHCRHYIGRPRKTEAEARADAEGWQKMGSCSEVHTVERIDTSGELGIWRLQDGRRIER